GQTEGRRLQCDPARLLTAKQAKLQRIRPLLREDMPFVEISISYDFLTPRLKDEFQITPTDNVSALPYYEEIEAMISEYEDGLLLDCGAGRRSVYYSNVVNYEVVDYPSTDVLGVGERLPFKNDSVDAVISVAVLEHVKDPFLCAREMSRVLKPGGQLLCSV